MLWIFSTLPHIGLLISCLWSFSRIGSSEHRTPFSAINWFKSHFWKPYIFPLLIGPSVIKILIWMKEFLLSLSIFGLVHFDFWLEFIKIWFILFKPGQFLISHLVSSSKILSVSHFPVKYIIQRIIFIFYLHLCIKLLQIPDY